MQSHVNFTNNFLITSISSNCYFMGDKEVVKGGVGEMKATVKKKN